MLVPPPFLPSGCSARPPVVPVSEVLGADKRLRFMLIEAVLRDGMPPRVDNSKPYDDAGYAVAEQEDGGEGVNGAVVDENLTAMYFGVTATGHSCCVTVQGCTPWFRVELPDAWTGAHVEGLRSKLTFRLGLAPGTLKCTTQKLKRYFGWEPDPKNPLRTRRYNYAKLEFPTLATMYKAQKMLQYPFAAVSGGAPVTLPIVDTLQTPLFKLLADQRAVTSDWLSVLAFKEVDTSLTRASNCQYEFVCHASALRADETADITIAPLVTASFDNEMFFRDGCFPSPLKGDFTCCISTNLWVYTEDVKTAVTRVVLFLGDVDTADGSAQGSRMVVVKCASSRELLERWRDLIVWMDPDIILGWNIYGFDLPFMHDEYARLYQGVGERGTEALQSALCTIASRLLNEPPPPTTSTVKLLQDLAGGHGGKRAVWEWVDRMEREHGARHIRDLVKAAGISSKRGSKTLDLSGGDDDDDDENADDPTELGEYVDIMDVHKGVPEALAVKLRRSLGGRGPSPLRQLLQQLAAAGREEQFWEAVQAEYGYAGVEIVDKDASGKVVERVRAVNNIREWLAAPSLSSSTLRAWMLSRVASETCQFTSKRMATQAKGENWYHFFKISGRTTVDLMQVIKDDLKPQFNSLKFAAEKWLGGATDASNAKIDMSAQQMYLAYASGDPRRRWDLAFYCGRDADLPLRLISRLKYVQAWVGVSRVSFTALNTALNGGQQTRVLNGMAQFMHNEYVVNRLPSGWPSAAQLQAQAEEKDHNKNGSSRRKEAAFQGATVIEPKRGFYDTPISTLDFASLYPSIMRYFNLCASTLVLLDRNDPRLKGVPIDWHPIPFTGKDGQTFIKWFGFVNHVQGVQPRLLCHLLGARKDAKKLMEACTDPFLKAVYDAIQKGLKVMCNSVYGFNGVSDEMGMLPCKPVAAVVTLNGRAFIMATKDYVEAAYPGSEVLYGDSVTGDTALALQVEGSLVTRRMDELVSDPAAWRPYGDGKECVDFPETVQVWTEIGFTHVRRIIRHKCGKRMFRVRTGGGIVDATEDHSLLNTKAEKVRPSDVHAGSRLLHAPLLPMQTRTQVAVADAWVLGAFMARGQTEFCPRRGGHRFWGIRADHWGLLEDLASKVSFPTYIAREGTPMLHPRDAETNALVLDEYVPMFFNAANEKIVPARILNATDEAVEAFWNGYWACDGWLDEEDMSHVFAQGKEAALGMQLVAQRLGYTCTVSMFSDGVGVPPAFCLEFDPNKALRKPWLPPIDAITSIQELPRHDGFVYDLETESHHFHVGPGRMVVHNTDSVMIKWGDGVTVTQANEFGAEAAKAVTLMLQEGRVPGMSGAGALRRVLEGASAAAAAVSASSSAAVAMDEEEEEKEKSPPRDFAEAAEAVELTNEKVYFPFLLFDKKQYAAMKHTFNKKRGEFDVEMDIKGLDPVRRDRPKCVRDVQKAVLDALLIERSAAAAAARVHTTLENILHDKLPVSDYVLTQALRGTYKNENLPQVTAWKRMVARGDEDIPPIGARMPYVITANGGKQVYKRAEHPAFVEASRTPIDKAKYIKKLENPLTKILQFTNVWPSVAGELQQYQQSTAVKALRMSSLHAFFDADEEAEEAAETAAGVDTDETMSGAAATGATSAATALVPFVGKKRKTSGSQEGTAKRSKSLAEWI